MSRKSYKDLYPYQHRMVKQILRHDACALWVEMGLGKTVATLTAIQELKRRFEVRNVLVVAPLRVAKIVWPDEIKEWDHINLKLVQIIGSSEQRLRALKRKADIHIINRENMTWLVEQYTVKEEIVGWPFDMVVLDESSSFKSSQSNRFKAIRKCLPYVTTMVQLSGTPMPNGIEDLWSQLMLLDRGKRLGTTLTAFRNRWMAYVPGSFKKSPRPNAEKEIKKLVNDIGLTMQAEDYLELPDMIENIIRVRLNDAQREKYQEMQKFFVMELEGETITAANSGVLWGKLLQLSNGAIYTQHPAWKELHRHKLDALLELHTATENPMLIAYAYLSDKDRIATLLNKAKANWRYMDTEKDAEDWNAGKFDRLVLHPASAGHGLNLHKNGCRDVCWFGLTANLEHYLQLNARIAGGHRAAFSNRPIVIHKILTSGTKDIDVNRLLDTKDNWQKALMKKAEKMVKDMQRAA